MNLYFRCPFTTRGVFGYMEEHFILPVNYKGATHNMDCTLKASGYSHRFEFLINNAVFSFEKDDSGSYRAICLNESELRKQPDVELLHAINLSLAGNFG